MHLARASIIVSEAATTEQAVKDLIDEGYARSQGEAMFIVQVLERDNNRDDFS